MAQIIRIARDNSAVIIKNGDTYTKVSSDMSSVSSATSLSEFAAGTSWRKPVLADSDKFAEHVALACGEPVSEKSPERHVRVPKSVQRVLAESAKNTEDPIKSEYLMYLATATTTTNSTLSSFKDEITNANLAYQSLGGSKALEWVTKLDKAEALVAAGQVFEPSDQLEYFAVSSGDDGSKATGLIAVNMDTDLVLVWTPEGFVATPDSVDEYEAGVITAVDDDTASAIASWVNEGGSDEGFDITKTDEAEFNLFALAQAENDWAVEALIADAYDYTPAERSGIMSVYD